MRIKLNFIATGVMIFVFLISCSKDHRIYDGDADSNQTLLRLDNQAINFQLNEDGTGSEEIKVLSSTKSDEDRNFEINFVNENNPNNAVDYDYDENVTIPAGEFIGKFEVVVNSSNIGAINPSLELELAAPDYDSTEVTLEKNNITITFTN